MYLYLLSLIALVIGCYGCTAPPSLQLHTMYIGKEQLASYHVRTPDPRLNCPEIGQKLMIQWVLSNYLFQHRNLHLRVTTRTQNGQENIYDYPVCKKYGFHTLSITGDSFQKSGGLATYKADLLSNEVPLLQWRHQLWNNTISVPIQE